VGKTAALSLVLVFSVAFCRAGFLPAKAEDSWVSKTEMPTARNGLGVAVINETIYAVGGNGPVDANEAYDSNMNAWTKKISNNSYV
jgi:hypothetical protein